jgi:type I restriction enzyme R subunit
MSPQVLSPAVTDFIAHQRETLELIKQETCGDDTKVINLIKSIEKAPTTSPVDPFLIAMAERAKQIQESYEDRQTRPGGARRTICRDRANEQRKKARPRRVTTRFAISCSPYFSRPVSRTRRT